MLLNIEIKMLVPKTHEKNAVLDVLHNDSCVTLYSSSSIVRIVK
jgi:hypothetical protein